MREKIVFFILGAVLATIAYFVGGINAQTNLKTYDEIQCRKLTVFGEVTVPKLLVMDPINKSGFITIKFNQDGPVLTIMSADDEGGVISLNASSDLAKISVNTVDRLQKLEEGMSLLVAEKGSGITIEGEVIDGKMRR